MNYPTEIADEFATMRSVRDGASLARFGDGELKLATGREYRRQTRSRRITVELCKVLNHPASGCLVGIPTLNPDGPKYANWLRHKPRFEQVIQRAGPFGSAFITRPDSAPWIECRKYFELVVACSAFKRVALVSEPENKLRGVLEATAREVVHVECPSHQAYEHIRALQVAVEAARPDLAVLSIGVTATCLAHRLAKHGIQAIDFGSIGGMLARLAEQRAA